MIPKVTVHLFSQDPVTLSQKISGYNSEDSFELPLQDRKKACTKKVAKFLERDKEIADDEKRNAEFKGDPDEGMKNIKQIIEREIRPKKGRSKNKVNFDKIIGNHCDNVFKSGMKKGHTCKVRNCHRHNKEEKEPYNVERIQEKAANKTSHITNLY